jgi:hypothetical protein
MFYLTFQSRNCTNTLVHFFQSSLFPAVLVYKFPPCFFMSSVDPFAYLPGRLDLLRESHVVAACA